MRKHFLKYLVLVFSLLIAYAVSGLQSVNGKYPQLGNQYQMVLLDANNIRTIIYDTGILNQDVRTSNTPGFEWPAGTNKYAIFTSGFNIGAYVDDSLHMATGSYKGEYVPGYVADSSGIPVPRTDMRFKFYKVKRGDNPSNNPDWLNWGLMVPFGAPFVDSDNNGRYDPMIDTPGVRNAEQNIFVCMTDGFYYSHKIGEGFGGGTGPLFAELHLYAWAYNTQQLQNVQFLKWEVVNKNNKPWKKTYFSVFSDNDLGFADDDYNGCDTLRKLGYTYNGDNDDNGGSYSYGLNPPAVGMTILESAINRSVTPSRNLGMSSFIYIASTSSPGPSCEKDANGEYRAAYNYMRGLKKDSTPWVIPNINPPRTTKYCYPGDPETLTGWTEYNGSIKNCGGSLFGEYWAVNAVGNRTFVISSGAENFTVAPGEKQVFVIAQLIARGTSNVNSVTKLKQLTDYVRNFYSMAIGIENQNLTVPDAFNLYQNYPNPFNPVTRIKFAIPPSKGARGMNVRLIIYDVLGKEVAVLMNRELKAGTYEVNWDASNYPSGVYFYILKAGNFIESKKMILLK